MWWGICVYDPAWGTLDWEIPILGYSSKFGIFSQFHINLIKNAGGNAIRLGLSKDPWDANDTSNVYGLIYKEYIKRIIDECHEANIHVMVDLAYAFTDIEQWMTGADRISMIRNQPYATGINRQPLTRQDWIDWAVDVVAYLPLADAIGIMDEPCSEAQMVATGFTAQEYYDFAVECIQAIRGINPAITVASMGVPFYHLWMFLPQSYGSVEGVPCLGALPFNNVFYYSNVAYEPSSKWGYNTATTQTELNACKADMDWWFEWKYRDLLNEGRQIMLTCAATEWILSPPTNWDIAIRDLYLKCEEMNIGQLQYGIVKRSGNWNLIRVEQVDGVWRYDLGWNQIGQFWVDNNPLTPPPPCSSHLTQAECEAAGCYWWDATCHSSPKPPIPQPTSLLIWGGLGLALYWLISGE